MKSFKLRLFAALAAFVVIVALGHAQSGDPYGVWNREAPKPAWENFFTESMPTMTGTFDWYLDARVPDNYWWTMCPDGSYWPVVVIIDGHRFFSDNGVDWNYFDDAAWIYNTTIFSTPSQWIPYQFYIGTLSASACQDYDP